MTNSIRSLDSKLSMGSIESVLSGLYRSILYDIGINNDKFHYLMSSYLCEYQNSDLDNTVNLAVKRSNLKNELLRERISWKVFYKGLLFIKVKKFILSIDTKVDDTWLTHFKYINNMNIDGGRLLNQMFDIITNNYHLDKNDLDNMLRKWIYDTAKFTPSINKDKSTAVSNLKNELFRETLTWKVFYKGMSLINIEAFTLRVVLTHHNNTHTQHEVSLIIR